MRATLAGRVATAMRERDVEALRKNKLCVPGPSLRSAPPTGSYLLASQYLLEDARLKRRETTVDIYLSEVGARTIDVECSLPNFGWGRKTWYLPLASFPKAAVAPDLEVTGCEGQVISIPTKQQNLALTCQAVDDLIVDGKLEIDLDPLHDFLGRRISADDVRKFISEVIFDVPVYARGRRLAFEGLPGQSQAVNDLMRRLEDKFVLWVPVEGEPQSHHFFRIRRQEIIPRDQIVAPKLDEAIWEIPTALGPCEIEGLSASGGPRIRFKGLLNRLPDTMAIRPLEANAFDPEARRTCSCHIRVNAPAGFLVRNVRAGAVRLPKAASGYPQIDEIDFLNPEVVIQGWDQNLAHVHLFKKRNPEEVMCHVTLSPRGGAITLWMLTAVLTAVLLWIVHHWFTPEPAAALPDHFQLIASSVGNGELGSGGRHGIAGTDKQIAAAALLVAPAFASAWSLRAEGGELLRSFFAGARFLLLLSAALSVASALALAGFPSDGYTAIEWYAAISYLTAMPLLAAWLLSRDTLWVFFRLLFKREGYNVLAAVVLAMGVVTVGAMEKIPDGVAGLIVGSCGLGLALVGANPTGQPLRHDRTGAFYRLLGGLGAIPVVAVAGSFLGFYGGLFPVEAARIGCIWAGISIIAASVLWIIRKISMKGLGTP